MRKENKRRKKKKSEPLVYKSAGGPTLQHDKPRSKEERRGEEEAEA
jgi:hypothetical protein